VLVGCYLVLLDAPKIGLHSAVAADDGAAAPHGEWWHAGRTICWIVVVVGICAVVIFGNGHGYASAKSWSEDQEQVANVTVNFERATPALLNIELIKGGPAWSRAMAQVLKQHRLSVFATDQRSQYLKAGIPTGLTAISTSLVRPARDVTLRGTQAIIATASDPSGVRSVAFTATEQGGHHLLLGHGSPIVFAWAIAWNTGAVPNGRYELASIATGDNGSIAVSSRVAVTIKN
jgi:hypothetical protein